MLGRTQDFRATNFEFSEHFGENGSLRHFEDDLGIPRDLKSANFQLFQTLVEFDYFLTLDTLAGVNAWKLSTFFFRYRVVENHNELLSLSSSTVLVVLGNSTKYDNFLESFQVQSQKCLNGLSKTTAANRIAMMQKMWSKLPSFHEQMFDDWKSIGRVEIPPSKSYTPSSEHVLARNLKHRGWNCSEFAWIVDFHAQTQLDPVTRF